MLFLSFCEDKKTLKVEGFVFYLGWYWLLNKTFLHIPKVSEGFVNKLNSQGVTCWDSFLSNVNNLNLGDSKKEFLHSQILESKKSLEVGDYSHFLNLPINEHWRLYSHLKDKCCFLDIETTGLSRARDEVTIIGLYDGQESKIFINGKNFEDFEKEFNKYQLFITFNGRCFDIPFLREKFSKMRNDIFHIDLRFVLGKMGFRGGLKKIEKDFGICRDAEIGDVTGFEAVRLWHKYKRGDPQALGKLIKYNIADIENLKILMNIAYDKLILRE